MTAALPAAELRTLLPDDEKLPDEVHQRILGADAAAIPGLLELAREELESVRADTESVLGFRANHAVRLLGELKASEAVPVLLDLVEACDPDLMLFNDALFAAITVGSAAGEACLARWERAPEHRYAFAQILAESGLRDERVYQRFLELLTEDPMLGAMALGAYGDARAIEPLRRRLAALEVDDEQVEPGAIIEVAGALKHLGAELSADELEKRNTAAELRRALAEGEPLEEEIEPQEPVRAVPRPGRNDPCWCGSGKKYKKCHDPELPPES